MFVIFGAYLEKKKGQRKARRPQAAVLRRAELYQRQVTETKPRWARKKTHLMTTIKTTAGADWNESKLFKTEANHGAQ